MEIRDLGTVAECRAVVDVQKAVWGEGAEIAPASVLKVSAARGGILLGAFAGPALQGFVWSMPGWRDGQPTQWSHMLGVLPGVRARGLGLALKLAQRQRALATPAALVEWTFDPLQAANAHLNLSRLGATAATYLVDAYGDMDGPLHRGTATDRLVAEWWIREPHVERRVSAASITARAAEVLRAPDLIATRRDGEWPEPDGPELDWLRRGEPRVFVSVPPRFGDLQRSNLDLAMAWRLATRDALRAAFDRGYRAVDFLLDRTTGGGRYLLARVSREAS